MMRALSRWAGQHARLAIALLIGCELLNSVNGVLLGANVLNGLSDAVLWGLAGLAVGASVTVRSRAVARLAGPTYTGRRWLIAGVFGSNWLLFVLLGAYWGKTVDTTPPNWSARGSRRVVVRADTLIHPADTVRKPAVVYDGDGYIVRPVPDRKNLSQTDRQTGKRVGFFLLFLLGLVLVCYSAGLACTIACSGYGALAALTFALGLGFFAGGIYFLGRTTEHPIRPLRELPLAMRRRAARRFWLSWLILLGIFSISLLTCSR